MKAAFLKSHGGTEVLEYGELPRPVVKAGEALVEVRFSSLNHLDIWVRKGMPGLKLSYPHVLGSDASGVVREVAPDVTSVKPGDEVIVFPAIGEPLSPGYRILGEHVSGTNAAYVAVPAGNCFRKPPRLSFEEAASLGLVFTTAWQMVTTRAGVKPGDFVLVQAAGSGVGMAAIQIAKLFGAEVIATAGSDDKLENATKLGAKHVFNYRTQDVPAEVKKITSRGVDAILDHVGVDTWDKNFKMLRWGGKVVLCGATSGHDVRIDLRQVFYKQLQILGSTMGSMEDFPRILDEFQKGTFRSIVDRVFPLEKIREAHAYLESRAAFGKVLLAVTS